MPRKKLDTTLNADMGKQLGDINDMTQELYDAPGAPGQDYSDLTVATANATDLASAQALANALKTNFNALVTRLSGG